MSTSQSLSSGQLDQIAPGVRRLVANNAGYMTGPGTNTYILGTDRFTIVDPGPVADAHIDRLLEETGGRVEQILVTHTHIDHSPGAKVIADRTGAPVLGRIAAGNRQDETFHPARLLNDDDVFTADDMQIRVLHTPGHASNHVCYLLDSGLLFTGDHLMQGSTVVISPPDGNMGDYLRSLQRLQSEPVSRLAPGHGLTIEDAQDEIARIIAHRLQREAKVYDRLAAGGAATLDQLVVRVYDDVDSRLHVVAKGSLLAHLQKLAADGRVQRSSQAPDATWSSVVSQA
jgi:glyoxylase-like metal-dependent hydrolase (beta-lactamase superfamily II)